MKNQKVIIIVLVCIMIIVCCAILVLRKGEQPIDIVPMNNEDNNTVVDSSDNKEVIKDADLGDNVKMLADGRAMNISEKLNKSRDFDGFNISDIRLSRKDDAISFVADIKNISKSDKKDHTEFKITLLDENENEIGTMTGMINPLGKDETITLDSRARGDVQNYINANDFKIEVVKK